MVLCCLTAAIVIINGETIVNDECAVLFVLAN